MLKRLVRHFSMRKQSSNRKSRHRRLRCEQLERRTLLTTFFVDNSDPSLSDLPGDNLFSEVQEAVDAAEEGDTIRVSTGNYLPFKVTSDGLRILPASEDAKPVIDGNLNPGHENGVEIHASRVTLAGFTIRNISGEQSLAPTSAFSPFGQGVMIVNGSRNVIKDNTFRNIVNLSIQIERGDSNLVQRNKLNDRGIYIESSDSNWLLDNRVLMARTPGNSRRHGISLEDSHDNTLRDNYVHNAAYAISLSASSDNRIQSNQVDNSFNGITLQRGRVGPDFVGPSSARNLVNGNFASGNTQFGIGVLGGIENRVVNNEIRGNVRGIVVSRGEKNQLIDNTASGNGSDNDRFGAGFEFFQTTDTLVARNTSYHNRTHGYWIYDSTDMDFVSNTARGNVQQGFKVEMSDENQFRRNTSSTNGLNGFLLEQSSDNTFNLNVASKNSSIGFDLNRSSSNSLVANISSSNSRSGFQVGTESTLNRLIGNEARGNVNSGFHVHGSEGLGNVLRNNLAVGNSQFGFSIGNSDGNLLVGNVARSNFAWGFWIGNHSDNNQLTANIAAVNGHYGFQLDASSDNNSFTENLAIGNERFGFFIETDALASNTFRENECANNRDGGDNLGGLICDA